MFIVDPHSVKIILCKAVRGVICAVLFLGAVQPYAQNSVPEDLKVFEQRAVQDANYEQTMDWKSVEDEADFWKDQRMYERSIKKMDYRAYMVYIRAKSRAYSAHKAICTSDSEHGSYYLSQASFYKQFGLEVLTTESSIAPSEAGKPNAYYITVE